MEHRKKVSFKVRKSPNIGCGCPAATGPQAHAVPGRPAAASRTLSGTLGPWEDVGRAQLNVRLFQKAPLTTGSGLISSSTDKHRTRGMGGGGVPGSDGSPNSTDACHQGPAPRLRAICACTLSTGHVTSCESGLPTCLGPDPKAAEPPAADITQLLRAWGLPSPTAQEWNRPLGQGVAGVTAEVVGPRWPF